jgi:hypothetical protein
VKVGDRVRVTALPPKLAELDDPATQRLFEQCLGRSFRVVSIRTPEGLLTPLFELHVGQILQEPEYTHSIWVEGDCLRLAD